MVVPFKAKRLVFLVIDTLLDKRLYRRWVKKKEVCSKIYFKLHYGKSWIVLFAETSYTIVTIVLRYSMFCEQYLEEH